MSLLLSGMERYDDGDGKTPTTAKSDMYCEHDAPLMRAILKP